MVIPGGNWKWGNHIEVAVAVVAGPMTFEFHLNVQSEVESSTKVIPNKYLAY